MLWTILVVLLALWLLGLATSYTLGGFIHLLLLVAIVEMMYGSRGTHRVEIPIPCRVAFFKRQPVGNDGRHKPRFNLRE